MDQNEKRKYLIEYLLKEDLNYNDVGLPNDIEEQRKLLRSLMNIRQPKEVSEQFLRIQDRYLKGEIESKGITDIADLKPIRDNLYLWQGDITTLKVDGIVNAGNNRLLGCFTPLHKCIDNAIHTFAGIELRLCCDEIMKEQNTPEPTGKCKITSAYNLPSKYILHTVGPIINNELTREDCELLASCYRSCLEVAKENKLESIAFCCISTGEFNFPNHTASKIAIETVKEFLINNKSEMKVIFNVFKDEDYEIYRGQLK